MFGEFCNKSVPLFRGDSEICQLFYIFKNLGTPDPSLPLYNLPYFKQNAHLFPKWEAKRTDLMIPSLDHLGRDLIKRMLQLDHTKRISANQALKHPYFFPFKQDIF